MTPAAKGWGVIKTSARPAAEGLCWGKRLARVLLRPGPREPESEADAPLSDLVGGRGTGSRDGEGCNGGSWPARPRGASVSATVGRARLPSKSFGESRAAPVRVHKGLPHTALPLPVSLNPIFEARGFFARILGCFSSFPPSQIF